MQLGGTMIPEVDEDPTEMSPVLHSPRLFVEDMEDSISNS